MIVRSGIVVMFALLAAPTPEQSTSRPQTQPEIPQQHQMVEGKAYVALYIPRMISPDEIARAEAAMALSEAQAAAFHAFVQAALELDKALRDQTMPGLLAEAERLGAAGAAVASDPALAVQHSDLISACVKFIDDLSAIEKSAFDGLEPLLADAQRPGATRALNMRERHRYAVVDKYRFTARVDLSDLLHALAGAGALTVNQSEAFVSLLENYEAAMTVLVHRHAKAQFAMIREVPCILAAMGVSQDPQERAKLDSARLRLEREIVRCEERMADLNRVYTHLLAALLVPTDAERFEAAFQVRAYPEVFPNPHDPTTILAAAMNYCAAGERAALDQIVANANGQRDALNDQMKRRVDRWMDACADVGLTRAPGFDEFRGEMDGLQSRRRQVAENAIGELAALFNQALPREVKREITNYRDAIGRRRTRLLGMSYVP